MRLIALTNLHEWNERYPHSIYGDIPRFVSDGIPTNIEFAFLSLTFRD